MYVIFKSEANKPVIALGFFSQHLIIRTISGKKYLYIRRQIVFQLIKHFYLPFHRINFCDI